MSVVEDLIRESSSVGGESFAGFSTSSITSVDSEVEHILGHSEDDRLYDQLHDDDEASGHIRSDHDSESDDDSHSFATCVTPVEGDAEEFGVLLVPDDGGESGSDLSADAEDNEGNYSADVDIHGGGVAEADFADEDFADAGSDVTDSASALVDDDSVGGDSFGGDSFGSGEFALDEAGSDGSHIVDLDHGGAFAPVEDILDSGLRTRAQATKTMLQGCGLLVALVTWALIAGVSSNNMELLFKILHAFFPDACMAQGLPKTHAQGVRSMAKAEKTFRGRDNGFVPVRVPVDDEVLRRRRITDFFVLRRSIKETVSRIMQNPQNSPGSLRPTSVQLPDGEYGDVMSSPMLRRIESLTNHVWEHAGVPEDERFTAYTIISNDGTAIYSSNKGTEASTLTIANLERDERNSHGNVKLLSVYRIPTLHHATPSSQKKAKYKPTDAERRAIRCACIRVYSFLFKASVLFDHFTI